ncbi:MAG: hypothetical protein Ct9H90mP2_12290 [Dehalococcoidia bacterium]|nr:MAG: hypothetical protein Ct9H90mP2_12290 [Dehalococcoidia bacterium]
MDIEGIMKKNRVNDELNEMYEEIVMDHYHNPRHTENLESPKNLNKKK